ncbi:MAG: PspC domain-containing protein [Armatimonadota bacterium]|nr:PspC domain-containing protein [Armatimonadota bacterium]MDR7402754.1 PspC domain-containing protein [Armatimonadota bacterium]MDR7404483.1 PspC domain-containing protein [Armatimonadota bacterium]MDR7437015.1 PspC domain-containing protein [Armatimonadota bacterium]MDR7472914.1 PspC domain-containing protein [Armatimonadota bacterium]
MARRLTRSPHNRILLGVAGGLAEHLRVDPAVIRALFLLLAFASGIGVLAYVALALLLPRSEDAPGEALAVLTDNLRAAPGDLLDAGRRVLAILRGESLPPGERPGPGREQTPGH